MAEELQEIYKRHTLNWLIQGASQHAGFTLHHLVRDELNALDGRLLRYYDQFALMCFVQYWRGLFVLMSGWPPRFWRRAATAPAHPFFGHPLLAVHGGRLAEAAKQRALARCKEKGVSVLPLAFSFQVLALLDRLRALEAPHRPRLRQLAKETASTVWGIPKERLKAGLSEQRVLPGDYFRVGDARGEHLRTCIIGYSEVERGEGQLVVAAKGVTWQLLAKELVKGTAELICLHGLTQLEETMYQRVLRVTDRLDLEPWMLQSGGELWRRLLAALPGGCPVAQVLMHLALLPPAELHATLEAVILESADAGHRLARLLR